MDKLIEMEFKQRKGQFNRLINLDHVVYMDRVGVKFRTGEHDMLVEGEYVRAMQQIRERMKK